MVDVADILKLDEVSLKEVEEIINIHEDLRMLLTREVSWRDMPPRRTETYEKLIEEQRKQNLPNMRKRIAILRQMKRDNCGGK